MKRRRRVAKNPEDRFIVYKLDPRGYGGEEVGRASDLNKALEKASKYYSEHANHSKNSLLEVIVANRDSGKLWQAYGGVIQGKDAEDLGLFPVNTVLRSPAAMTALGIAAGASAMWLIKN